MSKPFRLRPYQKNAVAAVVSRYKEQNQRRMFLYLPTGAGKTVIKEKYNPAEYALIICDECHRALAPSWEQVIAYFHSQVDKDALLLGMTATPQRTDGKSALEVFGRTAFEISRPDLEDLGYLVPMCYFTVRGNLELDKVKMSAGDFQVGALSKVMNTPASRGTDRKSVDRAG